MYEIREQVTGEASRKISGFATREAARAFVRAYAKLVYTGSTLILRVNSATTRDEDGRVRTVFVV